MIKFLERTIPVIILLLPLNPSKGYCSEILEVLDGDTVKISAPFLPKPLKPTISLRISGIDTPEKGFRAKCVSESIKGELAENYTRKLVTEAKSVLVLIEAEDKYFRLLGDVILNGKSLRESLLESGFALPYYGEKKPDWCKEDK